MSKIRLIGFPFLARAIAMTGIFVASTGAISRPLPAQETAAPGDADAPQRPQYPINVASLPGGGYCLVDLNLPGIWKQADQDGPLKLLYRGPQKFRQPMNRPRCLAVDANGTLWVGDSASRDVYRIAADEEPVGLTAGSIGIPMAIAVAADGNSLFVADAERRVIFRVPVGGGPPEVFARVNAKALTIGPAGRLWAVTPDAPSLVVIDDAGKLQPLVKDRPFAFPGGIALVGNTAYVTDGYGKAIWRVSAEGETEVLFRGAPLKHPVGISATPDGAALLVADPQQRQLFRVALGDGKTGKPAAVLPAK